MTSDEGLEPGAIPGAVETAGNRLTGEFWEVYLFPKLNAEHMREVERYPVRGGRAQANEVLKEQIMGNDDVERVQVFRFLDGKRELILDSPARPLRDKIEGD